MVANKYCTFYMSQALGQIIHIPDFMQWSQLPSDTDMIITLLYH